MRGEREMGMRRRVPVGREFFALKGGWVGRRWDLSDGLWMSVSLD